ncbi:hypothetical protein ACT3R2_18230, partial [Halomonas sp. AOP43-D1-39]|uniref:hypothetical protein n=1 Tax=Halomonas sp. AOP43-D1-39 TaxID=3457659 RepID=UPI0040349861
SCKLLHLQVRNGGHVDSFVHQLPVGALCIPRLFLSATARHKGRYKRRQPFRGAYVSIAA